MPSVPDPTGVIDRARHHLRRPLARTPFLYDAAFAFRGSKRQCLARRDSTIVIEGFPRSSNTFSVAAFWAANGHHHHIGRHLHAAAHVHRAVRLGLPTIVLVRDPADAVVSYLFLRPAIGVEDMLLEYTGFYAAAWRLRDRFVVGPCERVTTDLGTVIAAVNRRFGTAFARYEHTPENDAAAFRLIEKMNRRTCRGQLLETHVGRPSQERAARKSELLAGFQRPRAATILVDARRLHRRFLELADTHLI